MTSAAVAIEIVAALSKKPRQARGVLPGCAGRAATTTGGGEGGSGSGAEAVERSGKAGTSPAASGNDGVRPRATSRELNSDWMRPSSQKKKPAVQALVPARGLTIKNTLAGAWK